MYSFTGPFKRNRKLEQAAAELEAAGARAGTGGSDDGGGASDGGAGGRGAGAAQAAVAAPPVYGLSKVNKKIQNRKKPLGYAIPIYRVLPYPVIL